MYRSSAVLSGGVSSSAAWNTVCEGVVCVCVCVSPVVQQPLEILEQSVFVLINEPHHGVPEERRQGGLNIGTAKRDFGTAAPTRFRRGCAARSWRESESRLTTFLNVFFFFSSLKG